MSAIDHDTGEPVEIPLTAEQVERIILACEPDLPDPEDVTDDD